jgi:hypothetical protein
VAPLEVLTLPEYRHTLRLPRLTYARVAHPYLVNDSLLARVPYYEVGRQPVLGPLALTRFKSRYYGAARHFIIDQTKDWPRHVDVSVPASE